MSKNKLSKCPLCGQIAMGELSPSTGSSYIITEADETTNQVLIGKGFLVKLMACANCKMILLKNDTISVTHAETCDQERD